MAAFDCRAFILTPTAPGTVWEWPRCHAVGGKTNFWGRSSARFAEIDLRARGLDGAVHEWPVTYEEISPYYSRVEKLIGVQAPFKTARAIPMGSIFCQ